MQLTTAKPWSLLTFMLLLFLPAPVSCRSYGSKTLHRTSQSPLSRGTGPALRDDRMAIQSREGLASLSLDRTENISPMFAIGQCVRTSKEIKSGPQSPCPGRDYGIVIPKSSMLRPFGDQKGIASRNNLSEPVTTDGSVPDSSRDSTQPAAADSGLRIDGKVARRVAMTARKLAGGSGMRRRTASMAGGRRKARTLMKFVMRPRNIPVPPSGPSPQTHSVPNNR